MSAGEPTTNCVFRKSHGSEKLRAMTASDHFDRYIPLTGLLFVFLVLIGGPVLEGSTPSASSSGAHVISFYTAHQARERAAAVALAFAFVAFLLFVGALRGRWRRAPRSEALTAVMLAAATVVVAGQTATAGIGYALADAPEKMSAPTAQALNLLANDLVLTSAAGFLTFGLTAGLAVLRGGVAPAWIGWLAIVTGVLFVIPPIEVLGLLLLLVWTATTGVLLVRQRHSPNVTALQPEPV
jgi:hypothetical protein